VGGCARHGRCRRLHGSGSAILRTHWRYRFPGDRKRSTASLLPGAGHSGRSSQCRGWNSWTLTGLNLRGGGYSGITPSAATQDFAGGVLGYRPLSPGLQQALAIKQGNYQAGTTEAAILKDQLERRTIQMAPSVAAAQDVIGSDHPGVMINRNASYRQMWNQAYPEDPARLPPNLVRQRVAQLRDQMLAYSGDAPKGMPEMYGQVPIGWGGMANRNLATGQLSVGVPRQEPMKVGEQQLPGGQVAPVLYGPGGPVGAGGRAAAGGQTPGAGASSSSLAYTPPAKPEERQAATVANYMSQANDTLLKHEGGGYIPSLKARTLLVQAATAEGGTLGQEAFKQWVERAGFSEQDRDYVAAALPVMQVMARELPRVCPRWRLIKC
jgi:hypothetical protein